MINANCGSRYSCVVLAVLLSLIAGVVTALLTFMAVITVTPAFLWVLFGVATAYLLALPIISSVVRRIDTRACICSVQTALLVGLVGTILASLVLLGVTFAATSIVGALVTGALLAFFTLIITSTACLAKCATNCDD